MIHFNETKKFSFISSQIAKKSLVECDVAGGQEIFIIGKNFVKDSKLVWKGNRWLKVVEPNKEFLHSVSKTYEREKKRNNNQQIKL